jgi:hypothetical protein
MKKAVKITLIVLALLLLLVPVPMKWKDGGSVCYAPLTRLYEVRVYRAMQTDENGTDGWKKGVELYLFGLKLYGNTYFTTEK